jgi:hypothetical protein
LEEAMNAKITTLGGMIFISVIVHTVTYFLAGLVAATLFTYQGLFAIPSMAGFMRPYDNIWVMSGPLFQPLRGILFAMALFPLREILFNRKYGWLVTWWLLVAIGILSTYGPTPGSIEGLIYTQLPLAAHLRGLPEVLFQSFVYSLMMFYWINHAEKRWLTWVMVILFFILMAFPILGLLVR